MTMSLLSDYEDRTRWKYEMIRGYFHTHDGLIRKVNHEGCYVPFPGTTVVFGLEYTGIKLLTEVQQNLYERLRDTGMLAARLPASTFHMTLHDLISPEQCTCDPSDQERYIREMTDSLDQAVPIARAIQSEFAGQRISMRPDRIINMVSKSLVMLLKPGTERDYENLLEMYERFQSVVKIPYPFTPHVTLAYYRPGMLDGDRVGKAVGEIQMDIDSWPDLFLRPEQLTVQTFLDMQHYLDAPIEAGSREVVIDREQMDSPPF